jgi:outer membrane immunogenic protein
MKKLALGIAALAILTAAPAIAGTPSAAPVFSWTGCYVGLHAGAGWQTSSYAETSPEMASGVGVLGGMQTGCNYQWERFVVGLEGELWGSSLYDRQFEGNAFSSDDIKSRNLWDAAISTRMGLALFDRALVFGKLGAVAGNFKYNTTFSETGPSSSTTNGSATYIGVLMGLGLEYALTDNWTAKIEYNHIDYGNKIVTLTYSGCSLICQTSSSSEALKETKDILKLGVNYKF